RALLIGSVELILVNLEEQLWLGHRSSAPKIWRFSQRPINRQFHHSGSFAIGDDLVRLIHCHQAAVVDETMLADEAKRVFAERPRRRAIANGALASNFGQVINRLVE